MFGCSAMFEAISLAAACSGNSESSPRLREGQAKHRAGCARSGDPAIAALPTAPAFMNPVALPAIKAGDDARAVAARQRAAAAAANARLRASRNWYETLRKDRRSPN